MNAMPIDKLAIESLNCVLCDENSDTIEEFREHMRTVHNLEPVL